MPIREDLKALIIQSGCTMKEVVEAVNKKNGTNMTLSNFSVKLRRGNIRYTEVEEVLEILGYEIAWRKKSE